MTAPLIVNDRWFELKSRETHPLNAEDLCQSRRPSVKCWTMTVAGNPTNPASLGVSWADQEMSVSDGLHADANPRWQSKGGLLTSSQRRGGCLNGVVRRAARTTPENQRRPCGPAATLTNVAWSAERPEEILTNILLSRG